MTPNAAVHAGPFHFDPSSITRPAPVLLQYYALVSALTLFAFPFVFIPLYLRFRTLKYRFDDEGISISHGMLFRKEINLTYRRIQDIHVTMNVLQRWMGLATIEIQTASGSAAGHEGAGQSVSTHVGMIEGVSDAARIRDLIMAKVRQSRAAGLGDEDHRGAPGWSGAHINVLREIRDSMALARIALMALLFLGACTADEPVAELSTSPEELMEADREFAAETAARGLDGWMSFYTDDAARVQLGTASVRGLEGIRGFDAKMFDDSTTRLLWEPTDAGVFEDGRHGFTTGRSAFVRIDGDIPDTLSMGRYVTIWRLDSEGRPRVILDTGVQDP